MYFTIRALRFWPWVVGIGVILFVILLVSPGPLYYWSYRGFKEILTANLGWPAAWSAVAAVFITLGYTLLIPYALMWIVLGRKRVLNLVATVAILSASPLLHAVFGANFNQTTGAAQKWFSWRGGEPVVFDSGGIDPVAGIPKQPLTPEIARIIERAKKGIYPKAITGNPNQIAFFDSTTGLPRIWYSREVDERIALFDSEGFHPGSGVVLQPITVSVIESLKRQWAGDEERARNEAAVAEERAKKEAREASERALLEAERQKSEQRESAAKAEREAKEKQRRELSELFGVDSYIDSAVVVGIRAKSTGEDTSHEAARYFQKRLVDALRNDAKKIEILRPAVLGSPHFDALLGGDTRILAEIGLMQKIRSLVVAQIDAICRPSTSLAGAFSCNVMVAMQVVHANGNRNLPFEWSETGAGSSTTDALLRAIDHLAKHNSKLVGKV